MRKQIALVLAAGAALVAGPVRAADLPYYPPVVEAPDVDYGVSGSFYLRGSAAGNMSWAKEVDHTTTTPSVFSIDENGYGYSLGAGVGYETGTGLRFDATVDYLNNNDLSADIPVGAVGVFPGRHKLNLRSTIVLANAYYDFGLGDGGVGAGGGLFGYVGAGVGAAFNKVNTTPPAGAPADVEGNNTSFAAAFMAGVGYDMGAVVADIGYRGLYINSIANDSAPAPYHIDNALVHEVRASLRYRFN
ncbi:MAG TPA: hypothetical protein VGM83_14670 [Devosiaceae bacterium]|jgi:hypothetical protein